MRCIHCKSDKVKRNGIRGNSQRWFCNECEREFSTDVEREDFTACASEGVGNALFIGDLHSPFIKEGYFEFVCSVRDKYKLGNVYSLGDLTDQHYGSRHGTDPDGLGGRDEIDRAIEILQPWYREFPKMKICRSNHDERFFKNAGRANISDKFLKNFLDVYKCPDGYQYEWFYKHDGIKIFHGDGFSGQYGHITAAREHMCSVVIGHLHSTAGVQYVRTERDTIFGMCVGCGVDRDAYAMQYARSLPRKPVIACGVLVDGVPSIIPMFD